MEQTPIDKRRKLTYADCVKIGERYAQRHATGDTVTQIAKDYQMNRNYIGEVARRFQPRETGMPPRPSTT